MEIMKTAIDVLLRQARTLDEQGDRVQALELYKSTLAQLEKDDPRRQEIELALASLEVSNFLVMEPAQLSSWRELTGWIQNWRQVRWGALVLIVLFELGMLVVSEAADFESRSSVAISATRTTPLATEVVTKAPLPALVFAPTPLKSAPTAIEPPPVAPTPTATLAPPSPTSLPTPVPSPTIQPPANSASSNASGVGQVANPTPPGVPPTAVPPPSPAPTPPPQAGPTTQPDPAPQPGGSGKPGPGGNGGGDGKGKGGGGDSKGGGNGGGEKGKHK